MMSCDESKMISTADMENLKANITYHKVVVESNDSTATTPDGQVRDTLSGRLAKVTSQPLNGGVWAAGVEFTHYYQYMIYNGIAYKPKAATPLPYTSEAVPNTANVEPFELGGVDYDGVASVVYSSARTIDQAKAGATTGGTIIDLSIGQRWACSSYSDSLDSGVIFLEVVAAGTGTDDGGSYIDIDATYQFRQIMPIVPTAAHFGAVGSGVETTKLQNMLTWATNRPGITTVALSPNTTYTATDVVITTGTIFDLAGSVIKQVADSITPILRNVSTTDTQTENDIHVINGTLDGDSASYSADVQTFLLRIISVDTFSIVGVKFKDLRSINVGGGKSIGLVVSGTAKNYVIDKCHFEDMGTSLTYGNGIFAKGSYGVITNCIANRVYDTAFNFERMTYGTMANNIATNTGNGFAVTLESSNITVTGNVSNISSASGFVVDKFTSAGGTVMDTIAVTGNTAKNAGSGGGAGSCFKIIDANNVSLSGNVGLTAQTTIFDIQGCSDVTLNGGVAKGAIAGYNALVKESSGVLIEGLLSSSASVYGAFIWDSTNVSISGGAYYNLTQHNIRVRGGTGISIKGASIHGQNGVGQRAISCDTGCDKLTVTGNYIYDTRATPIQRGVSFDSSCTNVYYGGNSLINLVAGNYLTDNSTSSKGYTKKGTASARPTLQEGDDVGTIYLDTSLAATGKPIFWTGSVWVDASGVQV